MFKISQASLWVLLTTNEDTTQCGTSKQFGYNEHGLRIQDFETQNTFQCGFNKYLQSILNSTANATLHLILNHMGQYQLLSVLAA